MQEACNVCVRESRLSSYHGEHDDGRSRTEPHPVGRGSAGRGRCLRGGRHSALRVSVHRAGRQLGLAALRRGVGRAASSRALRWPGVALGGFLSSVLADHTTLAPAFVAAVYAPAEALIATTIIMRRGVFDLRLETVSSVMRLLLAAVVASAVTAFVGAWNVTILSGLDGTSYVRAWLTFFVGDALGMLTVAPPLLVVGRHRVSFQAAGAAGRVCGAAGVDVRRRHARLRAGPLAGPPRAAGGLPDVPADGLERVPLRPAGRDGRHVRSSGRSRWSGSARGLGPFGQVGHRGEAMLLAGFMNVVAVTALIAGRAGPGTRAGAGGAARHRGAIPRVHAVLAGHRLHEVAATAGTCSATRRGPRSSATCRPVVIGKTDCELWPARNRRAVPGERPAGARDAASRSS